MRLGDSCRRNGGARCLALRCQCSMWFHVRISKLAAGVEHVVCRFVTHGRNARPFFLRSRMITFMAATGTYAGLVVGDEDLLLECRHASLYPPSRRRNALYDLSKLWASRCLSGMSRPVGTCQRFMNAPTAAQKSRAR